MQNFLTLLCGFTFSSLGTAVSSFSLSLWVLQRTQSSLDFSLVLLAAAVPVLLVSPLLGRLADKFDRLKLMAVCTGLCIAVNLSLLLLFLSNTITLPALILLSALLSAAAGLNGLAFLSLVPELVGNTGLAKAQSWRSITAATISVLVPVLGGILMLKLNIAAVLFLDLLSYFFALLSVLIVQRSVGTMPQKQQPESSHHSVWRAINGNPQLWLSISQSVLINLIAGALLIIMPFYLLSGFDYQSFILITVLGATGSLVGGLLLPSVVHFSGSLLRGMACCSFILAPAIYLLATQQLILVCTGMLLLSASICLYNGLVTIQLQQSTAAVIRARVFAWVSMAAQLASILAMPIFGLFMDQQNTNPMLLRTNQIAADARLVDPLYQETARQLLWLTAGALFLLSGLFLFRLRQLTTPTITGGIHG